jgi:hypothetical protein
MSLYESWLLISRSIIVVLGATLAVAVGGMNVGSCLIPWNGGGFEERRGKGPATRIGDGVITL